MDMEDEAVDELMEQMKSPTLAEATFMDFAHRVEVLRDLNKK